MSGQEMAVVFVLSFVSEVLPILYTYFLAFWLRTFLYEMNLNSELLWVFLCKFSEFKLFKISSHIRIQYGFNDCRRKFIYF